MSATEHGDAGVVDLIKTLSEKSTHLASQEIALVKAEMQKSVNDLKIAVSALVGAAVVGIAGLGVFIMALGHLLGELIGNEGWGLLIVALLTLVIAFVLYRGAAAKMAVTNLAPQRTQDTLARTPDAATGNL